MAPKLKKIDKTEANPAIGEKKTVGTAQVIPPKDAARNTIASIYVYSFLGIVGVYILIGLWKDYDVSRIKDGLLAISGVLSGPLGFIIGYYFKANSDE
jgi:hypothetical protein